jgi:hypothetical protein
LSSFVDTNIAIYASGRDHPLKEWCLQILRLIADHEDSFVTDAEVLQEILHRYLSIRRWSEGVRTFGTFAEVMQGRIESVLALDVITAATLVGDHPQLSARDLIHLAVMRRLGVTRIVSADRGFDGIAHVARLDPARLDEWRATVAQ